MKPSEEALDSWMQEAASVTRRADGVIDVTAQPGASVLALAAAAEIFWVSRAAAVRGARAVRLDLRQAERGRDGLLGMERCGAASYMRAIPTALVVPQECAQEAARYGLTCAYAGAVVGTFTEPGPALEWAVRRGAAWRSAWSRSR